MMTMFEGFVASGDLSLERSENVLCGSAPYYRCYRCADERYISLGALEPRFWSQLAERLNVPPHLSQAREDWPETIAWMEALFASHPLEHWMSVLEGADACAAPVLTLGEAATHPHHRHRGTYVVADGVSQAAPGPRFSRSIAELPTTSNASDMLTHWRSTG
jgi:alpha-methylacyl-CoA racemase